MSDRNLLRQLSISSDGGHLDWITAVTLVQNIQSVTQKRVVEGGSVNTVCGRRHVILDTSGTPSRGVSSFVFETVVIWGTNNKTNLTSSPETKCRQQDYKTMGELEKIEMSESDYMKRAKVKVWILCRTSRPKSSSLTTKRSSVIIAHSRFWG